MGLHMRMMTPMLTEARLICMSVHIFHSQIRIFYFFYFTLELGIPLGQTSLLLRSNFFLRPWTFAITQ
ncbi:hypothetical protein EUGRSUZ_B02521 [Eucalyptus grandis]|uniref:Uncharacterized protein n=2 Tax=Eucalyptus grandis TaxID=71139 RepID=A0ACC3LTA4_EUCGR|nr:hypothetical protein EUGRSUZ_B02521 [Eucalyptus grandis]